MPGILGALGGFAIAASFLRFGLWPLAWVAFVPLLAGIASAPSRRRALRVGWLAGLATNVPSFHWLVGTIHLFGGFPMSVSVAFYAILSLYSAGQFVLLALGLRILGFGFLGLHAPLLWVALEFAYPKLFPWRLANSQVERLELLQIGDLTGPFGLSFVMVWTASAAVLLLRERRFRPLAASLVSVAGVVLYGWMRIGAIDARVASTESVSVGIVQGNLDVEEKGDVLLFESNLNVYRELTRDLEPRPDVVIWPESVITDGIPRGLARLPPQALDLLGLEAPLFTGAITFEGDRIYNSVVLFDRDGTILGMSDKLILMPFGEYLPFASVFPSLRKLSPMTGDFKAGERVIPLDVPGVARFGPLNCYEDLRSDIARRAVREGGAEILFAVANDGWFGNTAAPIQHEALALWRAVESRRYLVRVTNTGATDVVDPVGRIVDRLPVFARAATIAEVHPLHVRTVFTRIGDAFAWVTTLLAAALVIFRLVRADSR